MVGSCKGISIEPWDPETSRLRNEVEMLAAVLHACVSAGASVSFVLPFSLADAEAFWSEQTLPAVHAGLRSVLLARVADRIVGSVQLDFATPPNQPHRAEVRKLLVHPDMRRRGVARALMIALEQEARTRRRNLLTLDTFAGGFAERLYLSLGYVRVGTIPGYALNYNSSALEATTVMYKDLNRSRT